MLIFKDICDEIKRRATRNQSGTEYDIPVKSVANSSLFRLSREAPWRMMRRKTYFTTKPTYIQGSGTGNFTLSSTGVSITGATFLTHDVAIGRRIKLSGDSEFKIIRTITGEDSLTIDRPYLGSDTTEGTYSILGQEEYNLPIQSGHRTFLWHEKFGYPYKLNYITDQDFYGLGIINTTEAIPTHYRMWGEDMVREQLLYPSVLSIASSDSADTAKVITVYGDVSGYPDCEQITTDGTDGTTAVAGSKTFSKIERVVKNASTTGRITVSGCGGNATVAVLPVGDTTAGILYKKIQLYPLPEDEFDINVYYYKDPYRLVNDADVHELGQEFDEAIILLSVAKIKYQDNQKEGDRFIALYSDEVRNLRKTNIDKIDWFPSLNKARDGKGRDPLIHPNLSFRQVGAWYGPRVR